MNTLGYIDRLQRNVVRRPREKEMKKGIPPDSMGM
jgi:hypothetical protein